MKKSDKKIDNTLREALTEACDVALENIYGFKWLTHRINYNAFPESLLILCVFETNAMLSNAQTSHQDAYLCDVIEEKLKRSGISIRHLKQHIHFDTEENCNHEHDGNWKARLK